MITVAVHKHSKQVLIEVPDHLEKHRKGMELALHEIGTEVVAETRRLIENGNKTGRVYSMIGRTHQASAAGEAPASLTGRLARSGDYKVSGFDFMRVGETAPYAKFLEDGTKNMAPRPHLLKAANNTARNTLVALYEHGLAEINYK